MAGKDTNIGAKRAREARTALGLTETEPIACLLTTIEVDAATPVVLAWLPEGIAGCVTSSGGTRIAWVNGTQAAARQRFTLAHEYGHVRCGHDSRTPVDTVETLSGNTKDGHEIQANAFAAEFLAPASGVRELVDGEPTLETVVHVAARYGLSTIAALYRLSTLALTRRAVRLKREIEGGLADEVWERLQPAPIDDAIGLLTERDLPRLSPALEDSALAAYLHGDSSADSVARALGINPATFAARAGLIGA